MNVKSCLLVSLFLSLSASCSPHKPEASVSVTKAEIDAANNLITRYGLSEMPAYDELMNYVVVETKNAKGESKLPWTDTYWATTQKNLAARWGYIVDEHEANRDPFADFAIGAYFADQIEATNTSDKEISLYLSPAEKFDITHRSLRKLSLASDNQDLAEFIALDQKHEEFLSDAAQETLSKKKELAMSYLSHMRRGTSLAELSPLALEGYFNWLENSVREGNLFPGEVMPDAMDWSWEGICHGWAQAAVASDEPKHAVKVQIENQDGASEAKDLVFTEGDIRALLSKAWAEARNDEQFFIGRRCEANVNDPSLGVPSNEMGRGVTGTMNYTNEAGQAASGHFTLVQTYPQTSGQISLSRIILENEWKERDKGTAPKFAYLLENQSGRGIQSTLLYDEKAAFSAIETQTFPAVQTITSIQFFGCWDVNPASFHSVLVENIGKKNLGFVMDRTQSGQVWNQPVYKAEFKIGELKDVSTLESDLAKAYRAPGTAFIAEVTADVFWSAEPSVPEFTYTTKSGEDFDASMIQKSTYEYTLEFDANRKLIGGEWGTLTTFKTHENPDFLYGFTSKAEPNLNFASDALKRGYDDIIKKIHACSLQEKADGVMDVPSRVSGETEALRLPFVNCKL